MFELKDYQQRALDVLENFLRHAKSDTVESAFKLALIAQQFMQKTRSLKVEEAFKQAIIELDFTHEKLERYRHYAFEQTPYICLRLPTGGGKTVLASYAVNIAKRAYLEQDYPIVLWLVPTNTIREQTKKALDTPAHPYRLALEAAFGLDRLRVLDIGDVTLVCPQDIGRKAIIVVATLAALRVEDTSGRKVYAYHEDFKHCFDVVHPTDSRFEWVKESDLKEHGLAKELLGTVKHSFANLLMLHRPLVIMDEAHNARTKLTFDTLKRIHPVCIIEFSATPDVSPTSASNVLFHCTATELKNQQMIKLPILLTEHEDWQKAVGDAVLRGRWLNEQARKELTDKPIRPIVLFQAEAKNGKVTVDVLKNYLINELKIADIEIAIATGNQRDLDGMDLFAPDCQIKYIITIEALKEGWDCSFAYVFCSVKDVRSSKDAEQLLGRVLRMPFAKCREIDDLNRAYAHLASPTFSQAAQLLTDKLIAMGFEKMEAANAVQHEANNDDIFSGQAAKLQELSLIIELTHCPDLSSDTHHKVTETTTGTYHVEIVGAVPEQVAEQLFKAATATEKTRLNQQITAHNDRVESKKSPSQRGEVFAAIPQLCWLQNELPVLIEPNDFLYVKGDWSLLDFPVELAQFELKETTKNFEIDIENEKIFYQNAGENKIFNLNVIESGITENDLIRWLDKQVQQLDKYNDIKQENRLLFLSRLINHLIHSRQMPLTGLIRSKFRLAAAITVQINDYREQTAKKGFDFQLSLFEDAIPMETLIDFSYQFKQGIENYPATAFSAYTD